MFDRFLGDSRKALALSRKHAERLGHDFIGTEHVLLGLLEVRPVVDLLAKLGVPVEPVRRKVEELAPAGSRGAVTAGYLPFTPRAKRALELSMEAAHELGHDSIAPEHLILGLLREREGAAGQVLRSLDLDVAKVQPVVKESLEPSLAKRPWWRFW